MYSKIYVDLKFSKVAYSTILSAMLKLIETKSNLNLSSRVSHKIL